MNVSDLYGIYCVNHNYNTFCNDGPTVTHMHYCTLFDWTPYLSHHVGYSICTYALFVY